jgi:hypothetical protein
MTALTKLTLAQLYAMKVEKEIASKGFRGYVIAMGDSQPRTEEAYQAGLKAQSEYEDICAELIARGEFIAVHHHWPKDLS